MAHKKAEANEKAAKLSLDKEKLAGLFLLDKDGKPRLCPECKTGFIAKDGFCNYCV